MKHRDRRLIIFIVFAAFALRLFHLGTQSLWYDEGVSWYLTRFSLPELARWTAADIQPPLYYGLLWLSARLLGQSEFALRFPSVVFGVLSVPMVWQLARKLLPHRHSAKWAATMVTFSPLMVYYAQEARMYSLLVFQSVLASWLLWRILERTPSRRFWRLPPLFRGKVGERIFPLAYILVMASALYTHYFAAFLLLAHAVFAFIQLPIVNKNSTLVIRRSQFFILFGGVTALFAPWMSVLWARLGDDPSYWQGTLKLAEVLQDVAISFAVGGNEIILDAQGVSLAIGFAILLFIGVARWAWSRRQRDALIFLLLWLIIPIAGVILLSYQTPKFNPRYTMLAWIPFPLLITSAMIIGEKHVSLITHHVSRIAYFAAIMFVFASFLFALNNWFFVPQFSKDDFKHTAQFIRERSSAGDTVLLSSGHFFPVWDYYFDTENYTPLPKMETLDVNRVTDFSIIPTLENALHGRRGAWLVTWQNEVIDPNGVIPLLLDDVATRTEDDFHAGDFWGVGLHYWRLPDMLNFPADYPVTTRTDVNFGNLVSLKGFFQPKNNNTEIVLLWQAKQSLTEDYRISLKLVDSAGVAWSETQVTRPADYLFPTTRWQTDKIVAGRQTLRWLPATPPGEYRVEIAWLNPDGSAVDMLDAAGNPQGRTATLSPVRVLTPIAPPETLPAPIAKIGNLELLLAQFETDAVEAGSRVLLDSLWRIASDDASAKVTFSAWRDGDGADFALLDPIEITADYPVGTVFRSRDKIATPPLQSGLVTLWAQSKNGTDAQAIGRVTLLPTERNFVRPEKFDMIADVGFGGKATLLGANLADGKLTLFWRAENPFDADYTLFVHLLGADGTPALIADHAPPRPTSNWMAGEIIADTVTLDTANLPPGSYPIEVGFYNAADPTFPRLTRDDGAGTSVILPVPVEH